MQLDELDHSEEIRRFINVICNSNRIHALIIDGLPGWGKSTSVLEALSSIQQEWCATRIDVKTALAQK